MARFGMKGHAGGNKAKETGQADALTRLPHPEL
jgi:hypothetical protein